jgi:hypothetical protein
MPLFDFNKTLSQSSDALKSLSVLNPLTIRKKGKRAKAIFALIIVCILWGTTWLASKQGVLYIPDGWHQAITGWPLLCWLFSFQKSSLAKRKRVDTDHCVELFKFHDQQRP